MTTVQTQTTSARKEPKQRRSKQTVDAILTATEQVLVERGYDRTTTNQIARRAGVSIGSLYQYFPNKESLISALCERHMQEITGELLGLLQSSRDLPLHDSLRALIKLMLRRHAEAPEVHRMLILHMPRISGFERIAEVDRLVVEVIYRDLERRNERLRPKNLELAAFMLVHSVQAIIHAAVLDRPEALDDEAVADEVVDLVRRYLVAD